MALKRISKGAFGTLCATQRPSGERRSPNNAMKPAALYRKILFFSPSSAPTPAESAIAERETGAASATGRCKTKTSKGTDRMPPPAPVRPINKPTIRPRAGLMKIE